MAEEKKGSWLMRNFKKAAIGGLKLITIGVAAAVAWQMFLDPLFFLPIHDPTNVTMQAWVSFMNDNFGWIPDLVGATGDGGILNSEFAQNVFDLDKYKGISAQEMYNMNMGHADAMATAAGASTNPAISTTTNAAASTLTGNAPGNSTLQGFSLDKL